MKSTLLLVLALTGCAATPPPAPVLDPAPTAMLVEHVIYITDRGPVRRCAYTILGQDRLFRTADYCPTVLPVTAAQVQQAREQLEAPLP